MKKVLCSLIKSINISCHFIHNFTLCFIIFLIEFNTEMINRVCEVTFRMLRILLECFLAAHVFMLWLKLHVQNLSRHGNISDSTLNTKTLPWELHRRR